MPISEKNINILRKICFAEALLKETEIVPIDINEFARNFLGAIQILKVEREENFVFKINTQRKFLLDKKCLEILLILLSQNSNNVSIYEHKSELVVKTHIKSDGRIEKILRKMNAFRFYENKSGYLFAVLPVAKTLKKGINIATEKEILGDPYSIVNIFI